ncbi:cytochrome-c peroxidase [Hymenobacter edaphi]|uniref:Cytochrome C peroxidase n=1 Tax=Hymenobacter edaphi TaxID=2211146 RepID=A0A328B8S3_9BACT|nr:cytochrome c peroxidase [Hymenobacter edaphi]RAK63553.1 cytochrome C peroxidase [Hymenobacter edaphi]
MRFVPTTLRPLLLVLAAALFSFTVLQPTPAERTKAYYHQHLQALHAALTQLRAAVYEAELPVLQSRYAACRREYKPLEFAVEYYYPFVAQRLNGAALPESEPSEPEEPLLPTGFQVLEEYVYGAGADRATRDLMRQQADNLLFQVRYLQQREPSLTFTDAEVFDALRLNLYRLAAKGLSGFDSPAAQQAVPEAAVTLDATADVTALFDAPPALARELRRGAAYLRRPGVSFTAFDRAAFLTRHYNPILAELHRGQQQRGIGFVAARRAVRPAAVSFLAADAFDATFFAPADALPSTPQVLALGRALFAEPALSGAAGRSCASCHRPDQAYADGLRVNRSLQPGADLARNTPSLLGAALQPEQFYDGRVRFLEDQVHAVITNPAEMGGRLDAVSAALRRQKPYARLFAQAFPAEATPLTEPNIRRALAAYVRSLTGLNTRVDQFLRGDTAVLSAQEVRGFNLFMGQAQCGTCHYLPLFSGVVPPLYDKVESEVLGVPATADTLHPALDTDPGRYRLHRIPHQQFAFKTPTVRNAARTAPYMHNGAFQTLEEVVDFYNRGGGQGLGLAVPTQTLAPDRLGLSKAEKQALLAFLQALND